MYLPDDPWTRGKCGFKLIQYMALGKPVVASPVGANLDIVKHGVNGYLAQTFDDWSECLIRLLKDATLRESLGREARQTVEASFSVRACVPKLLNVLHKALAG
jgi:glycosyltransferase involved in cell wall biosynthesis